MLLASGVEVVGSAAEASGAGMLASASDEALQCTVGVAAADGTKCERCWNYATSVGGDAPYPNTCARCDEALRAMDFPPVTLKPAAAAEPAAA